MSTTLQITIADYERMIARGDFVGSDRKELIRGEVLEMSPIGTLHCAIVDELTEWSLPVDRRDDVRVRIQQPITLTEQESVPQPDVVWAARCSYRDRHPSPADVRLLIEVSDSSFHYDRTTKGLLYSEAGIEDFWNVNLPARRVEVFRQPTPNGYLLIQSFGESESVSPLCLPEITLRIGSLFEA